MSDNLFADTMKGMYSRPDETSGRVSQMIFVVVPENLSIREYTGWQCTPDHPDHWWCPDYGYSVRIGKYAFFTKEEAVTALRDLIAERDEQNRLAFDRIVSDGW